MLIMVWVYARVTLYVYLLKKQSECGRSLRSRPRCALIEARPTKAGFPLALRTRPPHSPSALANNSGRFSAGTCPPRPNITAAHCCHLVGLLPSSPGYHLRGGKKPCAYAAAHVRRRARLPHPSPFAPSPPVGALANRSVYTLSPGCALER